jgi:hypothetical protein
MKCRAGAWNAARAARRRGARRNEAKSGETKTKRDETKTKPDETGDCVLVFRKALIVKGGEIGGDAATRVFNDLDPTLFRAT